MLFLIVATDSRNAEYDTGKGKWEYSNGQIVLGTLYANDYEEAITEGAAKYEMGYDYIDAYGLLDT